MSGFEIVRDDESMSYVEKVVLTEQLEEISEEDAHR